MEKKHVLVVGGDKRQYFLAEALWKQGLWKQGFHISYYEVSYLEEKSWANLVKSLKSGLDDNDVILLPIPVSLDGKTVKSEKNEILLDELQDYLRRGQIIFGGNIPEQLKKKCKEQETVYVDYMEKEEIAIKNAVATAEGVIAETVRSGEGNIHGSESLIVGFGRCGEILADKLNGLKSKVTVMARREEARAKAEAYGYKVLPMFCEKGKYEKFRYIFNTVPVEVINEGVIDLLSKEVVIIDIASKPGGVNFDYCRNKGIFAMQCPSLPGKYAPKASGIILKDAVMKTLEQTEVPKKKSEGVML